MNTLITTYAQFKNVLILRFSKDWDRWNIGERGVKFSNMYNGCMKDVYIEEDIYFLKAVQLLTLNNNHSFTNCIENIDYNFSFATLLQILDLTIRLIQNKTLL